MRSSVGTATDRIQVATFDCYGTLVDWEGGAAAFLYELVLRDERDPPPGARAARALGGDPVRAHPGAYRSYREVLAEVCAAWAASAATAGTSDDGEALVRSMGCWQPFPDTGPALARREAGVRLVIISNTDRDIIEHTLRQIEVPFDGVTGRGLRAYKPVTRRSSRLLEHRRGPPSRSSTSPSASSTTSARRSSSECGPRG